MASEFRAHTLAEIFSDLYHAERSGVLLLRRAEEEKRVYFDRGMIVFAESSVADEDMGTTLVRQGRISAGALSEAKGSIEAPDSAVELAGALINRDLISKTVVSRAMVATVDRVVRSVFRWDDGRGSFREQPVDGAPFETDILSTVEVILDGIFCMAGFEPIFEAMQGLDNRLQLCQPTPFPVERLTLSASHGFILSRVDGQTSLQELISILPPGEEEIAARFVFGLLVLRVLEYSPTLGQGKFRVSDVVQDHADRQALERMQEQMIQELYVRVRGQNAYEILGVNPAASHQEIERSYERIKAQHARDRVLPKVRERFRSELSIIESRLIESFLTLTQANRPGVQASGQVAAQGGSDVAVTDLNVRVEIDRAKSKVEMDRANRVADGYFAKGRKCALEGDFHNAIQYGKLAISHNPSDARYFCLLGDCQARNPEARWQRMAEENYVKATQLDPWNAHYWVCLGRLYKRRGMKLRARRNFEEALKLVPNKPEILNELADLD